MGERLMPPVDELFSPHFASWWRNLFENPVTVQFDHRVLVRPSLPVRGRC
jgi:cytochrome c oxidase assembly protein subunit 15